MSPRGKLRGEGHVGRLALGLERAFGGSHFKALLMGHPGVGKSTELSRLAQQVEGRYSTLRFNVTTELDASSFRPFDVLLYMMAEVAERTARPRAEGGAGIKPSDSRLKELWEWFAVEPAP